jgi:glycine/D-amino acid oxidase-like deaminating enzyme
MIPMAFDVIIVGGGIVGTSAALKLRNFGLTVCLLERGVCGSRSSGINYGGVRRQGRSLAQMPLTQRAHSIWGRLKEIIGIDDYTYDDHLGKHTLTADEEKACKEYYKPEVYENNNIPKNYTLVEELREKGWIK